MIIKNPTFFIGYDSKEDIAYRVCRQSLTKNSSIKINVIALKIYELTAKGKREMEAANSEKSEEGGGGGGGCG